MRVYSVVPVWKQTAFGGYGIFTVVRTTDETRVSTQTDLRGNVLEYNNRAAAEIGAKEWADSDTRYLTNKEAFMRLNPEYVVRTVP